MKIIEPSFQITTPFGPLTRDIGIQFLRFIELQSRISHRSEDRQTEVSWLPFIKAVVLDHGDWSVTEHVALTVVFRVDRGVTHELVRHRLFSFTQESTRFVRYGAKHDLEFIYPESMPKNEHSVDAGQVYDWSWRQSILASEDTYNDLLSSGTRPQEARSILPNALAATIAVSGNLRNWRHFLLMRTSKETHPDFRRVTIPLLKEFKKCIPLLYDDIEPEMRQIDNLRKAR